MPSHALHPSAATSAAAVAAHDHSLIQFQGALLRSSTLERINSGDSVMLTAHTGAKVAVIGTEFDMSGTRTEAQETFVMVRGDGVDGHISSGDQVLLKVYTGKEVSVSGTSVFARWSNSGTWERFVVERAAGPGIIHSGEFINFRAHTGKYLSVDNHGELVAKWDQSLSWEQFVIQKKMTKSLTPKFNGQWAAEPSQCDPEMNCYRLLTVTCKDPAGEELPFDRCDPKARPPSYEACHLLGEGVCVNIAPIDCIDVPGCWWNRWHLTCREFANAGACNAQNQSVQLSGFSAADAAMVSRVCPVSCSKSPCGNGNEAETTSGSQEHPGTLQCEAETCEDDPGFSGHAEFGVVIGHSCSQAQGANCDAFSFAAELKVACPRSCGLCR